MFTIIEQMFYNWVRSARSAGEKEARVTTSQQASFFYKPLGSQSDNYKRSEHRGKISRPILRYLVPRRPANQTISRHTFRQQPPPQQDQPSGLGFASLLRALNVAQRMPKPKNGFAFKASLAGQHSGIRHRASQPDEQPARIPIFANAPEIQTQSRHIYRQQPNSFRSFTNLKPAIKKASLAFVHAPPAQPEKKSLRLRFAHSGVGPPPFSPLLPPNPPLDPSQTPHTR